MSKEDKLNHGLIERLNAIDKRLDDIDKRIYYHRDIVSDTKDENIKNARGGI